MGLADPASVDLLERARGKALAAGPRTSEAVWGPEFLPFAAHYSPAAAGQSACKQPFAYETADLGFLQLVANQVAVSVENALASDKSVAARAG